MLIGSENQKKQAEEIFSEAIDWVERNIVSLRENGLPEEYAQDLHDKAFALINAKRDAKWWIDRRKLQMGVPAEYQDKISEELQRQIPPLRQAISAQYDIVWQIRGLRKR